MEVQGEIIFKKDVQVVSEKFRKREFVVKTQDQYPQEILLQLVQDKCELVNNFAVGSVVKCHINIRGRGFVNKEGVKQWFNSLEAWKIEMVSAASTSTQTAAATSQTEEGDLPF